ncbi:MAG TPA: choice-of-anchor tandem repeat GloVer-containing protein [Rhizomicrobium sp.]|jgi:uncharacterized repeat protein (TIGR03803 family)|nr:choice-of-anchor tandem repeat GloVer-containing protein [Rhizomicrobium sp.]
MQGRSKNNFACLCAMVLPIFLPQAGLCGHSYKVLYTFQGGSDGYFPLAPLIRDKSGNFYGATEFGGGDGCENLGCGTIFKLAPDGTKSILHAFTGGSDGALPVAGLVMDRAGHLFGTALGGGEGTCAGYLGCGTVFELDPGGTFTILYSFTGGSDGAQPGTLIAGPQGSLTGATAYGGNLGCYTGYGCGVIYQLKHSKQTVVHTFSGADGEFPGGFFASGGKLYGGAGSGGDNGYGVIYRLAGNGKETVLHSFDGTDGWGPGRPVVDEAGNFYGTTSEGGDGCEQWDEGCGTLFQLAPDGTLTVLHDFDGQGEGGVPSDLVRDAKGNLYGTTNDGGDMNCDPVDGCGEIFEFTVDGSFKQLHVFAGTDGEAPVARLLIGSDGHLYGTTSGGGNASCQYGGVGGCGVIFEIKE